MADTHETITDIIAEMKGEAAQMFPELPIAVLKLATRLDAAHRRERGDCAKLREALKHIKDRLPHMLQYMRVHWEDASAGGYFDELMLVTDAALNAPPRNCDVGTAQEQIKRWQAFCNRYDDDCTGCPCEAADTWDYTGCFAKWAQMPYEEGGAK